jgi:hypothetical protein
MLNSISACTPKFGATQLQKPIWACVVSNGDGSSSAIPFSNERAANAFSRAYMKRMNESEPSIERLDKVYDSAKECMKDYWA